MEAAIISPIFELLKCLQSPIARRIGYVKNLKSNFEKLKDDTRELQCSRDDINEKITRSGNVHTKQFEIWSDEVERVKNRVGSIEANKEQDKKCFKGCCPNISSRKKLGKEVVGLIEKISNLQGRINLDNFTAVPPPLVVERVSAPNIKPGSSIDLTLERVMGSIRNADIHKIGIWGMGGVGKTTLMKKLNNLPEIAEMFNIVIWVTISKDWNITKVQNEIALKLSLNLSRDDPNDNYSRKIHTKLENTRYMLLLDDVWDNVNLEEVGIPITNSDKGCRVVLTTRSRDVCKMMGTNTVIKMEVLSEVEALELFREKVGNIIDSPKIQLLVRDVAKECGGLPLAIIVLGGALRDEADVRVWRNALQELKSANPSELEVMEDEVFRRLMFSYDRLNFNRKRCFLYGALYPENYKIPVDELIEYWRASGFLDGAGSLSAAYDRGHAILSHLINASLYEKDVSTYDKECVKMHDVIRDLALRITSMEENKFLVRAGRIERFPRDEEWREFNGVSLMNTELVKLPEGLTCHILSTLLLQHNSQLEVIPEASFESMTVLRVLDLSGTGIKSLPPSISNLVNLRGLYLENCVSLSELPSEIGALERLEVLRLVCYSWRKGIQYLPMEVSQLANLRCLNFSLSNNNSSRIQLPKGILSGLSQLEDLRICVYKRGELWVSNVPEIIGEVCNLSALSHLSFTFPKLEQLESFIQRNEAWNNGTLLSFNFIVNGSNDRDLTCDFHSVSNYDVAVDRRLTFENGEDCIPDVIKQVLHRTQVFYLWGHKAVKSLSEFGAENLMSLNVLDVKFCPEIETLIDKDCGLANLETLVLLECHGLKNVFSQGTTIQQLTNLKVFSLLYCDVVSDVISGDVEYGALPRLEALHLSSLPNLERICKQLVLAWSSIEYVYIYECEKLKSLPFGAHNSSTLREINCKKEWWNALRWEDPRAKAQLDYAFNDDIAMVL